MLLTQNVDNICSDKHMKKRFIPIHLSIAVIHFGLDPDYIYNMYQTIPSIKAKDDFVVNLTTTIFDPSFKQMV